MRRFFQRLKRGEVGAAAVVVGIGILVSRVLGIIRDIVFASMLGATGVTDEYVAAFRIPDFANYLLAGGFLTITFIPIFARYIADDDEAGGWFAFTAILRWLAVGITTLIIIAWAAAPAIIEALYPSFTPQQIDSTIHLTRIVLPAQFAFVVGAMFAAVQYTKGSFTIPTLAPIIYNAGIISGGIAFAAITGRAEPAGFIWGALVGAFVGNLLLQVWGAQRVGMRIEMSATWKHPAVVTYAAIAFPLMLGQSIVALDETFMSVFGARVGDGAATELQYARRTMFVPVGVIAQAAAVAAYPTLARLFAEGKRSRLYATVNRALRYVTVLSIGAAAVAIALSLPIMRILFERGEFTPPSTASAASALVMYAFAIPVWGVLQIVTRAFYARRQMWTPVIVGSGMTLVAIPAYFAMQGAFGIEGVALASATMLAAYTLALLAIWYRPPDTRAGLMTVLRSAGRALPLAVPAGFAAFGVSWLVMSRLGDQPLLAALASGVLGIAVFGVVVVLVGAFLHDALWHRAARRARQAASRT
ncbi:MAG: murein biosynthesis integral membrane protein MurJ [Acidimicrobiia bacterium]